MEGAISWIEGIAAQWLTAPLGRRFHVLAAVSASVRLSDYPHILRANKGRRVTIIPDADEAGEKALNRWGEELIGNDCQVKVARLPQGFKDLGDLLKRGTDAMPALRRIFAKGGHQ